MLALFGSLETTRLGLGLGLALDSLEIPSLRMSPAALAQPNRAAMNDDGTICVD